MAAGHAADAPSWLFSLWSFFILCHVHPLYGLLYSHQLSCITRLLSSFAHNGPSISHVFIHSSSSFSYLFHLFFLFRKIFFSEPVTLNQKWGPSIHLLSLFAHTHLNCTRSFYHHHHHLAAHGGVYPLSVVVLSAAGAIRWQHHARIIERRSSSSFFLFPFCFRQGSAGWPFGDGPYIAGLVFDRPDLFFLFFFIIIPDDTNRFSPP